MLDDEPGQQHEVGVGDRAGRQCGAGVDQLGVGGDDGDPDKSTSISISRLPPCSSVKLFAIASPSPEPSVFLDSSPRLNRSIISSAAKFIS